MTMRASSIIPVLLMAASLRTVECTVLFDLVPSAEICDISFPEKRTSKVESVTVCGILDHVIPESVADFDSIFLTGTVDGRAFWVDTDFDAGSSTYTFATSGDTVNDADGNPLMGDADSCVMYDRQRRAFTTRNCVLPANIACFADPGKAIPSTPDCTGGQVDVLPGPVAAADCDVYLASNRNEKGFHVGVSCTGNSYTVPRTVEEFQSIMGTGTIPSSNRLFWLDTRFDYDTFVLTINDDTMDLVVDKNGYPVTGSNSKDCAVYDSKRQDIVARNCRAKANIVCFMNDDLAVNPECVNVPFCNGAAGGTPFGNRDQFCTLGGNLDKQEEAVAFCEAEGGVLLRERQDFLDAAEDEPNDLFRFWTAATLSDDESNYVYPDNGEVVTLEDGTELRGDRRSRCVMFNAFRRVKEFVSSDCNNLRTPICKALE